jgi:hypothetical protein
MGNIRLSSAPGAAAHPPGGPLRRGHMSCETSDVDCPPDLFGAVQDRWLVPRD